MVIQNNDFFTYTFYYMPLLDHCCYGEFCYNHRLICCQRDIQYILPWKNKQKNYRRAEFRRVLSVKCFSHNVFL